MAGKDSRTLQQLTPAANQVVFARCDVHQIQVGNEIKHIAIVLQERGQGSSIEEVTRLFMSLGQPTHVNETAAAALGRRSPLQTRDATLDCVIAPTGDTNRDEKPEVTYIYDGWHTPNAHLPHGYRLDHQEGFAVMVNDDFQMPDRHLTQPPEIEAVPLV